jgi:hypothetical protein
MATLLVLGSKPDPALPPESAWDDLACANASGFSAAQQGLPRPAYTVISAILTSGIGSGRQSLRALQGLSTETLYYFPRPLRRGGNPLKRLVGPLLDFRTSPFYFRHQLRRANYTWNSFVRQDNAWYQGLVAQLCQGDADLLRQLQEKSPSTGIMTLVVGMSLGRYERFILSGFSFELTHSYAANPEIDQRGTKISRHTPTDVRVLGHLSDSRGNLFTTEQTVHEKAGIPLLSF